MGQTSKGYIKFSSFLILFTPNVIYLHQVREKKPNKKMQKMPFSPGGGDFQQEIKFVMHVANQICRNIFYCGN